MNLTSLLQKIQKNPTSGTAPETIILPTGQKLYEVDLSTRTISGPETLSVQSDHYAETVYFITDRYYDHMDLARTNCVIQYVANGESYVYAVPFCDITTYEGKIIIPWSISLSATRHSGNIRYFIKFYLLEDTSGEESPEFIYSLNTLPASSMVLRTLSGENFAEDFSEKENKILGLPEKYLELVDVFAKMVDNSTIYWNEA